jgi:hypothetical protein
MSGGKALAKRYPALKKQMDAVKLTINDAVFEVLEAVSGKSVGTALVRVGWGPESFDSVFSVGDFLICVRDEVWVTGVFADCWSHSYLVVTSLPPQQRIFSFETIRP